MRQGDHEIGEIRKITPSNTVFISFIGDNASAPFDSTPSPGEEWPDKTGRIVMESDEIEVWYGPGKRTQTKSPCGKRWRMITEIAGPKEKINFASTIIGEMSNTKTSRKPAQSLLFQNVFVDTNNQKETSAIACAFYSCNRETADVEIAGIKGCPVAKPVERQAP